MAAAVHWSPDREQGGGWWPAALSLTLHGGALALVLVLASAPEAPPIAPPPQIMTIEIAVEAGAGPVEAAASPAEVNPAPPLPPAEIKPVRTPRVLPKLKPAPAPAPVPAATPSPMPEATAAAAPAPGPEAAEPSGTVATAQSGAAEGRGGSAAQDSGEGRKGGGGAMEAYLALVRSQVQRALVYPAAARRLRLAGLVWAAFSIDAEGRIAADSARITGGADDTILRQGALDTLHRLATLPPPPSGAIGIQVPIVFTLTEHRQIAGDSP